MDVMLYATPDLVVYPSSKHRAAGIACKMERRATNIQGRGVGEAQPNISVECRMCNPLEYCLMQRPEAFGCI
jgi:hypothetical protein